MHRNMPVDLVLVRHGQSEAQKLARQGQLDLWTSEFRDRHNSLYRLTDTGRTQARIAGEYIRNHISPIFDKYFTSEYVRAMETAATLELPHARWATEVYLRERDRGVLANKPYQERVIEHRDEFLRKERDAFYWQPSGGESIANLCLRVDRVLENLGENCSGLRVIVVCHGGVIKSFRALIERVRSSEYRSHDKIHNCQIVWYTRRDPKTGYISSKYNWVKSICPWDLRLSRYTNEWREVRRYVYSNVELLRSVSQVVQLVNISLGQSSTPAATAATTASTASGASCNIIVDISDSSDSDDGASFGNSQAALLLPSETKARALSPVSTSKSHDTLTTGLACDDVLRSAQKPISRTVGSNSRPVSGEKRTDTTLLENIHARANVDDDVVHSGFNPETDDAGGPPVVRSRSRRFDLKGLSHRDAGNQDSHKYQNDNIEQHHMADSYDSLTSTGNELRELRPGKTHKSLPTYNPSVAGTVETISKDLDVPSTAKLSETTVARGSEGYVADSIPMRGDLILLATKKLSCSSAVVVTGGEAEATQQPMLVDETSGKTRWLQATTTTTSRGSETTGYQDTAVVSPEISGHLPLASGAHSGRSIALSPPPAWNTDHFDMDSDDASSADEAFFVLCPSNSAAANQLAHPVSRLSALHQINLTPDAHCDASKEGTEVQGFAKRQPQHSSVRSKVKRFSENTSDLFLVEEAAQISASRRDSYDLPAQVEGGYTPQVSDLERRADPALRKKCGNGGGSSTVMQNQTVEAIRRPLCRANKHTHDPRVGQHQATNQRSESIELTKAPGNTNELQSSEHRNGPYPASPLRKPAHRTPEPLHPAVLRSLRKNSRSSCGGSSQHTPRQTEAPPGGLTRGPLRHASYVSHKSPSRGVPVATATLYGIRSTEKHRRAIQSEDEISTQLHTSAGPSLMYMSKEKMRSFQGTDPHDVVDTEPQPRRLLEQLQTGDSGVASHNKKHAQPLTTGNASCVDDETQTPENEARPEAAPSMVGHEHYYHDTRSRHTGRPLHSSSLRDSQIPWLDGNGGERYNPNALLLNDKAHPKKYMDTYRPWHLTACDPKMSHTDEMNDVLCQRDGMCAPVDEPYGGVACQPADIRETGGRVPRYPTMFPGGSRFDGPLFAYRPPQLNMYSSMEYDGYVNYYSSDFHRQAAPYQVFNSDGYQPSGPVFPDGQQYPWPFRMFPHAQSVQRPSDFFSTHASRPASHILHADAHQFQPAQQRPLNIPPLPVPYTASPPRDNALWKASGRHRQSISERSDAPSQQTQVRDVAEHTVRPPRPLQGNSDHESSTNELQPKRNLMTDEPVPTKQEQHLSGIHVKLPAWSQSEQAHKTSTQKLPCVENCHTRVVENLEQKQQHHQCHGAELRKKDDLEPATTVESGQRAGVPSSSDESPRRTKRSRSNTPITINTAEYHPEDDPTGVAVLPFEPRSSSPDVPPQSGADVTTIQAEAQKTSLVDFQRKVVPVELTMPSPRQQKQRGPCMIKSLQQESHASLWRAESPSLTSERRFKKQRDPTGTKLRTQQLGQADAPVSGLSGGIGGHSSVVECGELGTGTHVPSSDEHDVTESKSHTSAVNMKRGAPSSRVLPLADGASMPIVDHDVVVASRHVYVSDKSGESADDEKGDEEEEEEDDDEEERTRSHHPSMTAQESASLRFGSHADDKALATTEYCRATHQDVASATKSLSSLIPSCAVAQIQENSLQSQPRSLISESDPCETHAPLAGYANDGKITAALSVDAAQASKTSDFAAHSKAIGNTETSPFLRGRLGSAPSGGCDADAASAVMAPLERLALASEILPTSNANVSIGRHSTARHADDDDDDDDEEEEDGESHERLLSGAVVKRDAKGTGGGSGASLTPCLLQLHNQTEDISPQSSFASLSGAQTRSSSASSVSQNSCSGVDDELGSKRLPAAAAAAATPIDSGPARRRQRTGGGLHRRRRAHPPKQQVGQHTKT